MCVTFVPVTYNDYVYPVGAQAIGFMMALASMLCIPGYAVYALLSANGSLSEVCHSHRSLTTPKLNQLQRFHFLLIRGGDTLPLPN